ncbi:hypothetical protein SNE40_017359 [Patella caerulea]|uniref:Uncharacterized protein n=1 Tax=Patella caerulea TaxID=87958 RepID=A0AAN8JAA1_PATCE
MVISYGVEELLLQFESKRDNANRRNYKDDRNNPSAKDTPINNVHVTANMDDRNELIKLFNQPNRTEIEDQLVADLMKANYGYIQADIRKETSMNELKHLWPFFFHEKFFMKYFNELTEFDLSTAISTVAETQFTRLHKNMLNSMHLVDLVEGSDMCILYQILCKDFNEDEYIMLKTYTRLKQNVKLTFRFCEK